MPVIRKKLMILTPGQVKELAVEGTVVHGELARLQLEENGGKYRKSESNVFPESTLTVALDTLLVMSCVLFLGKLEVCVCQGVFTFLLFRKI